MTTPPTQRPAATPTSPAPHDDPTIAGLVSQLTSDVTALVKDELRLAQVEVSGKAKRAGLGVGLFGAAGLVALYGVGVLVATAVVALALVLDAWLAGLLVGLVLLLVAGALALVARNRVNEAAPPVPERAAENVKRDVDAVRHARD